MSNVKNLSYEEELLNCNFVKLMLMLLIVLYHSSVFWGGKWLELKPIYPSASLSIFSTWLNSFHIYTFVLVSGYIFYYLKYEKNHYKDVTVFILNKVKRLLIPYYIISCFWVIPINLIINKKFNLGLIIRSLGGAASQLWFLWMLFWVYIIAWFISDYFYKYNIRSIILICCFYASYILTIGKIPNIFQILFSLKYLPFFLLGFKIRQYSSKFIFKIPAFVWLFIHSILFILVENIEVFKNYAKVVQIILNLSLHIVGAIMAFVFFQKLAKKVKWEKKKWLKYLESKSMAIYLFHQQFIYFVIYTLNGRVNPYINMIVNFCVAIMASLIIINLIIRNNLLKKLIGEK